MRRSSLRLLLTVLCFVANEIQAKDIFAGKFTKTVSRKEFYELTTGSNAVFTLFFGEPCDNCDRFAPEWIDLSEDYSGPNVNFIQVDCELEIRLCRQQSVGHYPQIRVYQNGEIYKRYQGIPFIEMMREFFVGCIKDLVQETTQ